MANFNPDDLSREKSLLAIYLLGQKFPHSNFNRRVAGTLAFAFVLGCATQFDNAPSLIGQIRKIAEIGLNFAASIMGFLIAGFTVFVTVTKIEIFSTMAQMEYEQTGESYLKYNLVQFMLVFSHYIGFVFLCLLVNIGFQPGGAARSILLFLHTLYPRPFSDLVFYRLPAAALLVLLSTWAVYLILLLKSFVYNTYQVITTTVLWEIDRQQEVALSKRNERE